MATPPIPEMTDFFSQIHWQGEQRFQSLLSEILRGEIKGLSEDSD